MPTLNLTKPVIDDLKPQVTDQADWDQGLRGLGLKVTPAGRKVFIVMNRTIDGRHLLKYILGPYGVMTLVSTHAAAPKDSARAARWTGPGCREAVTSQATGRSVGR